MHIGIIFLCLFPLASANADGVPVTPLESCLYKLTDRDLSINCSRGQWELQTPLVQTKCEKKTLMLFGPFSQTCLLRGNRVPVVFSAPTTVWCFRETKGAEYEKMSSDAFCRGNCEATQVDDHMQGILVDPTFYLAGCAKDPGYISSLKKMAPMSTLSTPGHTGDFLSAYCGGDRFESTPTCPLVWLTTGGKSRRAQLLQDFVSLVETASTAVVNTKNGSTYTTTTTSALGGELSSLFDTATVVGSILSWIAKSLFGIFVLWAVVSILNLCVRAIDLSKTIWHGFAAWMLFFIRLLLSPFRWWKSLFAALWRKGTKKKEKVELQGRKEEGAVGRGGTYSLFDLPTGSAVILMILSIAVGLSEGQTTTVPTPPSAFICDAYAEAWVGGSLTSGVAATGGIGTARSDMGFCIHLFADEAKQQPVGWLYVHVETDVCSPITGWMQTGKNAEKGYVAHCQCAPRSADCVALGDIDSTTTVNSCHSIVHDVGGNTTLCDRPGGGGLRGHSIPTDFDSCWFFGRDAWCTMTSLSCGTTPITSFSVSSVRQNVIRADAFYVNGSSTVYVKSIGSLANVIAYNFGPDLAALANTQPALASFQGKSVRLAWSMSVSPQASMTGSSTVIARRSSKILSVSHPLGPKADFGTYFFGRDTGTAGEPLLWRSCVYPARNATEQINSGGTVTAAILSDLYVFDPIDGGCKDDRFKITEKRYLTWNEWKEMYAANDQALQSAMSASWCRGADCGPHMILDANDTPLEFCYNNGNGAASVSYTVDVSAPGPYAVNMVCGLVTAAAVPLWRVPAEGGLVVPPKGFVDGFLGVPNHVVFSVTSNTVSGTVSESHGRPISTERGLVNITITVEGGNVVGDPTNVISLNSPAGIQFIPNEVDGRVCAAVASPEGCSLLPSSGVKTFCIAFHSRAVPMSSNFTHGINPLGTGQTPSSGSVRVSLSGWDSFVDSFSWGTGSSVMGYIWVVITGLAVLIAIPMLTFVFRKMISRVKQA